MNQVTNLIQYKNLTEEQKADFDFEGYKYEFQGHTEWFTMQKKELSVETVYRLVIEENKWYYWEALGLSGVTVGRQMDNSIIGDVLRPARPEELPKTKTLEERIQEKWPDKEVVILGYDNMCADGLNMLTDMNSIGKISHVLYQYQSMKGFSGYVYNEQEELRALLITSTIFAPDGFIFPVAVLFEVKK